MWKLWLPFGVSRKRVLNELRLHLDEIHEEIEKLTNDSSSLFDEIRNKIELINKRINELDNERKRIQDGYKREYSMMTKLKKS